MKHKRSKAEQEHFAWENYYDQKYMRRWQNADCERRMSEALIKSGCFAQVHHSYRHLLPNPLPVFTNIKHPADD